MLFFSVWQTGSVYLSRKLNAIAHDCLARCSIFHCICGPYFDQFLAIDVPRGICVVLHDRAHSLNATSFFIAFGHASRYELCNVNTFLFMKGSTAYHADVVSVKQDLGKFRLST